MKVHFLGGAGTVTGSKTLIETSSISILIDCGLFQGLKELRELNRLPLSYDPKEIDFVLLTHGHLDHCGWLPKLVQDGFKGKIFCTSPTKEIARLILMDSAKIQEEEAEKANNEHYSKHNPAIPLYTIEDVQQVLPLFKVIEKDVVVALSDSVSFSFFYASHILGACSIALDIEGKKLVFSGDIGQDDDILLFPAVKPKNADYIFLESTYGNRVHPNNNPLFDLEIIINNTYNKGGNLVIPSFAVERVQVMMYLIWKLKKENKIPDIPYIIDTPMGIDVLELFLENRKWHKLNYEECSEMCKTFTLISEFKDTIEVIYDKQPKVVIAASGMITGGRVLSYLERYITKPENTVALVGYQAEGTRGRKLLEGDKTIKMYGKIYEVEATILSIEGLSAHGDQKDLINWLTELENKPQSIFLVHGENEASEGLKNEIETQLQLHCIIPKRRQIIEI
ncbi:MBL fold metallo-hydrolase [Flavobacterium sp. 9AF]|uniref:MBL fold metallo-hydrolase RNA specificity domain-containing protein n=1 Tax=Flavobacterium sp. 9AF TaxID=2653142 RepID=UPI0012F133FF|nr:MBL fold metallo-hydrolase [Flavobacterium sp. 9AF]VXB07169.1 MBL fold metallo-hydrolase [Flavobacterium sp. 9AF]